MFIGNYKTVGIVNENKKIVKDELGKLYYFALFKEIVDSPQKRTEKTEEVSMIFL